MNQIIKHLLLMIIASLFLAILSILLSGNNPFSSFGLGYLLSQTVILTGISFLIGGIPSLIIYFVKNKLWKGFFSIIWIIWFLIGVFSMAGQILYKMNG